MRTSCGELQKDCKRLKDLVIKWQMKFRTDKCKMTHMEKNNPNFTYEMMGSELTAITQKLGLGVIIYSFIELSAQLW